MPRKAKENKLTDDVKKDSKVSSKNTSKTFEAKKSTSKVSSTTAKAKVDKKVSTSSIAKTEKNTPKTKTPKSTNTRKSASKSSIAKVNSKPKATDNKTKNTSVSEKVKKATKKSTSRTNSKKDIINTKRTIRSYRISTKSYIKKNKAKQYISEYYDLPYKYNKTVVKLLAQTPNTLFVYWEISDEDKLHYMNKYGENFFSTTRPVLIIHNKDYNYSYEVPINDFANSWYIKINDAKSKYEIELGRRPIYSQIHNANIGADYIYITSSNIIEAPNDHILFDKLGNSVFFRNVKTNQVEEKQISSLSFMRRIGKLYNIQDLYKLLYKDDINAFSDKLDLTNPSSGNPTSSFK